MEPSSTPAPEQPGKGLPPVAPPSGRFIAQLFLVPGLIVLVSVLLLMMFHGLFGGSQTAEQYLRQLDSDNPDIRWRAASDLSQAIERSESLDLWADRFCRADCRASAPGRRDEWTRTAGKDLSAEEAKAVRIKSNPQRIHHLPGRAAAKLHTPAAIPDFAGSLSVRRRL